MLLVLTVAACGGGDPKGDTKLQQDIASSMQLLVRDEIRRLNQAARDLQTAAPSTVADWGTAPNGGTALASMKEAWMRTRSSWERTEEPLARLFGDLDESMDSRYEATLDQLGGAGDGAPFDGRGVIGMHAAERILFAPGPLPVAEYESTLPGSWPAAWPTSDQEAVDFKAGVCQRLVDDSQLLLDRWQQQPVDLGIVLVALTSLMSAQAEKVNLAARHQEESRYSQTTMADLRSNLAGTRAIFDLFMPWLATKPYGKTLSDNAQQAFDRLDQIYGGVVGDAIPPPPSTWGSNPPLVQDLESQFGTLHTAVVQEVDPMSPGSAVDAMNHVARALGISEFTGQN